MKLFRSVLIAAALTASAPVFADAAPAVNKADGVDFLTDVVLRPVGFIGTVFGTALYIGMLPATAINNIYEPHDNFEKLADLLIINPGKFTFTRPVGDYAFPQTEK
ncbi:MAG: hypothetical protein ACU83V_04410 [Gammaproteobacteria bacterium]